MRALVTVVGSGVPGDAFRVRLPHYVQFDHLPGATTGLCDIPDGSHPEGLMATDGPDPTNPGHSVAAYRFVLAHTGAWERFIHARYPASHGDWRASDAFA